jgi:hypothetical protein
MSYETIGLNFDNNFFSDYDLVSILDNPSGNLKPFHVEMKFMG